MATVIHGINPKQGNLLQNAFGYESYPNGNSGHTPQATAWVEHYHGGKFYRGNPSVCSELILKKAYFTHSQIRELQLKALERNVHHFDDWRFQHAISLLAQKPNNYDRQDAVRAKIAMVSSRITALKEVKMVEDIPRLEHWAKLLKEALAA